jgi:hypothetical protein
MYHYHAHGLHVVSELKFPELLPDIKKPDTAATVSIMLGDVSPLGLSNPIDKGLFHQITRDEIWLHVPPIGHFLMTDGNLITVSPTKKIDKDSLRECVLSTCFKMLLLQRHLFLIQASVIKVGESCIALAGVSGAGKSTLAAAFVNQGYTILADDFAVINSAGEVVPGFPLLKLWEAAAKPLNIDTTGLKKIRPRIRKFTLPLREKFQSERLPIKAMYVLNDTHQSDYSINPLLGAKKILCLQNMGFKKNFLKSLEIESKMVVQAAKTAHQVAIAFITRPHDEFKLNEGVALIEHDLRERGLLHE